jgi:hypothetical protein
MNLKPIKANMTELELDGMKILFSYETPVAVLILEGSRAVGAIWHQYKTEKFWSRTTSRHINTWNPLGGAFGVKPQEYFDSLIAGVK